MAFDVRHTLRGPPLAMLPRGAVLSACWARSGVADVELPLELPPWGAPVVAQISTCLVV